MVGNPLDRDLPAYLRLPNNAPDTVPVRVGVILPFTSATAATRNLAAGMMKAAELALFDGGNRNILLITADEGATPDTAAAAASKLLSQGAEIIVGPLFGPSVSAVAPIARERGIPVLAFSTERSVAGNGVYLLSFLSQSEVRRVVNYAVSQGHHNFAAMVPETPYGDVITGAFTDAVKDAGATSTDIEHFTPNTASVTAPSTTIAKNGADAVMIAQGGGVLRAIGPTLVFNGLDPAKTKLLGTGLWDDPNTVKEQSLTGGWFAAPEPNADDAFNDKYRAIYGANPPQLASLAYDALSLVCSPVHRRALSSLHGAGADGPQWFCRRQRHFPLQCRWHLGAGLGRAGSAAGRLSCREPVAQDVSAEKFLVQQRADYSIQHQTAWKSSCEDIAILPEKALRD